jgi:UDP-N-acetylmuramyl pentapeptide phosphotransferase/UDP-N-acetylglucosamine-1-phosphate transferase
MTLYMQIILAFFLSAFLVYILIPAIVRLSVAKKLFDVPNERRVNMTVVPNLGGIALFAGICISSLLCIRDMAFTDFRYILAAMIIMFYTGLKDDILMITANKKFLAQIFTGIILVVAGNIRITNLHGILGIHEISYVWSFGLSMLAIVAVINSINLIDGIDGLAAGIGIFISLFFGTTFFMDGHIPYAILSFSIAGSLVAFIGFNVFGKKNKIFMGDTGSLLLGTLFAVMTIRYNEFAITSVNRFYSPAISLAVISVPLFDMARVFCVRVFQRRSPFMADMCHIHHKLLRLGYSHKKSAILIISVNILIVYLIYLCGIWILMSC